MPLAWPSWPAAPPMQPHPTSPTEALPAAIRGDLQAPLKRNAPIRVLLISDLILLRAGLRQLLESAGFVIVGEADNCQSATIATERQRPDIILLDLDSPGCGFECLDRVLTESPESRILALADRRRMTEHPSPIELGAFGVVLK